MLTQQVTDYIKNTFNANVKNAISLHGGSINDVSLLTLSNNTQLVAKTHSNRDTDKFRKEANGLKELKSSATIKVPEVIHFEDNFLLTEYIKPGKQGKYFFYEFGKQFAALHKYKTDYFGFFEDNYIGSNYQPNAKKHNWTEFYLTNRLLFQYNLAVERGHATEQLKKLIFAVCDDLEDILSHKIETGSLLHGDLWHGNFLCAENNVAALIDPAVYYGDPEADLAMTKLFGGFSIEFYAGYLEVNPLPDGYEYRENIYKLYHVLNHLNIFGGSYYNQAISLLKFYQ